MRKRSKTFYIFLSVFLLALVIRLAAGLELYRRDVFSSNPPGGSDMATYLLLSQRVAAGDFTEPYYYQPFYYAVFLPLLRLVFDGSVLWVALAQAALGAAAALLAALTARRLAGNPAGAAAGLLCALSAAHVLYTPYCLIEVLQSFFVMLTVWLAVKAMTGRRRALLWGLAGLSLSCSVLTRGNMWVFLPALIFFMALGARREKPSATLKAQTGAFLLRFAVFGICLAVPMLPFVVRNSRILVHLSGPSTAGGAVLALGNTPEAPPGGRNPGTGPGPMEYPKTYEFWMKNEDSVSIPARIYGWAVREPAAFLELTFRKLLLFWDSAEIPNNIAFEHNGKKSVLWGILAPLPTAAVIMLGAGGILLLLGRARRSPAGAAVCCCALLYWVSVAVFYNLCRFRVPVIPLLCVPAGVFTVMMMRAALTGNRGGLFKFYAPALLFGAALTFGLYDFYRNNLEAGVMRLARPSGIVVGLQDGETMVLDNGPMSFGGWSLEQVNGSVRIEKILRAPAAGKAPAVFELTLAAGSPGEAIVSVNGSEKKIPLRRPGLLTETFSVPAPEDGKFDIKIQSSPSARVYYVLDTQRSHNRTKVNGLNAGAELVCRVFIKKEKDSASAP
jgi:hypothetical protein